MRQAFKYKNIRLLPLALITSVLALGVIVTLPTSVAAIPTECLDANCSKSTGTQTSIPVGCPGNLGSTTTPTDCPSATGSVASPRVDGKPYCGQYDTENGRNQAVITSFDIGCTGKGSPITDAAFAIIRFLSIGVGLIIVGSLTFAGIQYTVSRGDPKATAEAIGRIRSNVIAFLIFVFSFAILNFLIPSGFFGL